MIFLKSERCKLLRAEKTGERKRSQSLDDHTNTEREILASRPRITYVDTTLDHETMMWGFGNMWGRGHNTHTGITIFGLSRSGPFLHSR